MGHMSDWGMELLWELSGIYFRNRSIRAAIQELADMYMNVGEITDREWLVCQITAVYHHPEMFGQDQHYWKRLMRVHTHQETKRLRIAHRRT